MVSIYELKPKFQKLLMPVVRFLHTLNITPNQVTLAACCLSIALGIVFYYNYTSIWIYIMIPVFMFVRMAMNAIDGVLAKEYNLKSNLGKYLNELTDVVSDAALFIPFILVLSQFEMTVVLFVILSIVSEMAGVIGETVSGERRYDGPMGKSDRAFIIGAVSVLLAFNVPIHDYLWIVFLISSLLIIINIYKRIKHGLEGAE